MGFNPTLDPTERRPSSQVAMRAQALTTLGDASMDSVANSASKLRLSDSDRRQ